MRNFQIATLVVLTLSTHGARAAEPTTDPFARENLVAWCIVPFDARHRGPAERAEMLQRLGLKRVAYDWRQEHVPTFEEEIRQYQQNGLEYFAFWSWHDDMGPLIRKYQIHPQIWQTNPSPSGESQADRVEAAARALAPLVAKTRELQLKLGLYNHGGWGGEPANLVAVCRYLRDEMDAPHVGIVYNFHHGHEHIGDFESAWAAMQPYVLCLNINGMADAAEVDGMKNKIIPVGSGKHERGMLAIVKQSGYHGPIGILDHRNELDAEISLRQNLTGLAKLVRESEAEEQGSGLSGPPQRTPSPQR